VQFSTKFEAAEFLAKFANLELDRLDSFREEYPGFFPEKFWTVFGQVSINRLVDPDPDLKVRPLTMARLVQIAMQDIWRDGFTDDHSIGLIGLGNGSALGESWDLQAYPYQTAIMFLHNEPWRAKICEECGGLYVADHPLRRYCSRTPEAEGLEKEALKKCSQKGIQKARNKWWDNVGKQRRAEKAAKAAKSAKGGK
jgi:hypothetical protein